MRRRAVDDEGSNSCLDDVDRKVKHVDKENRPEDDAGLDTFGLWVYAKDTEESSYKLPCPRQYQQRYNSRSGTPYYERSSLSPSDSAIVAFDTHIGLYESSRERPGYPY